jgi:hypothetical protein
MKTVVNDCAYILGTYLDKLKVQHPLAYLGVMLTLLSLFAMIAKGTIDFPLADQALILLGLVISGIGPRTARYVGKVEEIGLVSTPCADRPVDNDAAAKEIQESDQYKQLFEVLGKIDQSNA